MHVYRFRILFEDVEDFYRDIEIMSTSTFEDFHKAIMQSIDITGNEFASFYICDSKWNRKKEIAVEDMSDEGEEVENAPLVMSKCKLADYIDDPHQRLIYIYDFLTMNEFYIELSKIIPADKKVKYPRCVRKSGMLPKSGSPISSRIPSEFDEEEIFVENEDGIKDDDDTLGLYTDTDVEGGFIEEPGETFDDDKF